MTRPFGVYRVIGRRKYRGHDPGTVFEAYLDPAVEQRAIARRAIELLRREAPTVEPAKFEPPAEWRSDRPATTEAPTGVSTA